MNKQLLVVLTLGAVVYGGTRITDPWAALGLFGVGSSIVAMITIFVAMVIDFSGLAYPVKRVIGNWLGYDYNCGPYDQCSRWVKKGTATDDFA